MLKNAEDFRKRVARYPGTRSGSLSGTTPANRVIRTMVPKVVGVRVCRPGGYFSTPGLRGVILNYAGNAGNAGDAGDLLIGRGGNGELAPAAHLSQASGLIEARCLR